jgi:uncharacterized protein YcnI
MKGFLMTFTTSARHRITLVGALVVGAGLLLAGTASAHVTVQPGTAEQGGFTKLAFRAPNERANASTSKLEVTLPTDHPISFVSTRALPGWTAIVEKAALPKPVAVEGATVTEAVSKITWTGGKIGAGQFEDFEVSIGPLPKDTDKLVFKAVQTYDNGEVVSWIDTAADGAAEPAHPAPTLALKASATTIGVQTPVSNTATSNRSTTDNTGFVLGIVGTATGLIALVLAFLAWRRASASAGGTRSS